MKDEKQKYDTTFFPLMETFWLTNLFPILQNLLDPFFALMIFLGDRKTLQNLLVCPLMALSKDMMAELF